PRRRRLRVRVAAGEFRHDRSRRGRGVDAVVRARGDAALCPRLSGEAVVSPSTVAVNLLLHLHSRTEAWSTGLVACGRWRSLMFLRNGWYAAIWSNDLQARPLGRTLLNEKVVLFRNGRGQAAALEDCCCHRAAPLSKGEVSGDYIVCGYHGLKYDINGQCVEVPGQTMIPRGAKVRSYPVCEKWGAVWIWMGEPAKADESKIPNLYWLADPAWTATPRYIHLKSNYQFLIDNLLDLTHVIYVHKKTLAGDPREATTPTKTKRLPDGVRVGRWLIDFVPPPLYAKAGNFTSNVDRWQFATWN